ncbi:MAG: hypothetical protein SGI89_02070 [bacterium]|nr:hypothetical protein [bacterium]
MILTASSALILSIISGIIAVIKSPERKLGLISIIVSLLVLIAMAAFILFIAHVYG